jgi:hypothetical protein
MVHYGYDTTALANGTAKTILDQGGKTWFFITADYAFGTQLQQAATKVVESGGGKVVGSVRAPLSTSDFSLRKMGPIDHALWQSLAMRTITRGSSRSDPTCAGAQSEAAPRRAEGDDRRLG